MFLAAFVSVPKLEDYGVDRKFVVVTKDLSMNINMKRK